MLFLVGVFLLGFTQISGADGVGISATVAAPPVSGAAAITAPAMNQHVTITPIQVTGLCQVGTMIKLYDNGVFAGSTFCVSKASFSLQADLYTGRNDLIVREYNAINQPGQDSATVTVYYDLTASQLSGLDNGGGQLLLISNNEYKGSFINQEISWPLEIHGGTPPYSVSWDWGDGQTDTLTRSDVGAFSLKHTYTKKGIEYKSTFPIVIRVIDANGQAAYLQLVTIVNSDKNPIIPADIPSGTLIAWPLWVLALMLVATFWLGEAREKAVLRWKERQQKSIR
jgi:peptidoglycan hydrolase-like protein with peptidoglycan-binding domain